MGNETINIKMALVSHPTSAPAAEASADAARSTLQTLRSAGILINDEAAITEYLQRHHDVLKTLRPIATALTETFQEAFEISLQLFQSRSSADHYPVFFVRTEPPNETLMDRIRAFRENHQGLFSFSSGWVAVTTDFASPQKRV